MCVYIYINIYMSVCMYTHYQSEIWPHLLIKYNIIIILLLLSTVKKNAIHTQSLNVIPRHFLQWCKGLHALQQVDSPLLRCRIDALMH